MWRKNRKDKTLSPSWGKINRDRFRRLVIPPIILISFVFILIVIGLFSQTHKVLAETISGSSTSGASNASGTTPIYTSGSMSGKNMSPVDAASSFLYYQMLSDCANTSNLYRASSFLADGTIPNSRIRVADANAGLWFDNGVLPTGSSGQQETSGGYFLGSTSNSQVSCSSDTSVSWILDAISAWGYKNGVDALCAFGAMRTDGKDCITDGGGSSDFTGNKNHGENIDVNTIEAAIKSKVYGGQNPTLSKAQEYIFYLDSFNSSCLGNTSPQPDTTNDSGDDVYSIAVISNTGVRSALYTKYDGVMGQNDQVFLYGSDVSKTCSQMASTINNDASAYQIAAKALTAKGGAGDVSNFTKSNSGSGTTTDNSCGNQVSGIGWIICPVLDSLTKLDDGMWKLVSNLLNVNPIEQSGSIYQAWGSIRSIANVLFVMFFLVIIFSQLTGAGITNYGVKKMLPKVIIAAILVNISFIIIQIGVDLANIVGSSLYTLIVGMAPTYTVTWGSAEAMLETGLAGLGATVAAVALAGGPTALFFMLLGLALISALGLITAVLTLIFRQAAILVLAILAPLAFVAYLLPNTESWFKKWRGLMLSMLMMYPLAALVFAGAQFAAATIIGNGKDFWNILIGLTMMSLPLFSLPFIARQGGSILSKVNGAISGAAQKASSPIKDWSKSHSDLAAAEYRADNGRRGLMGRYSPSRHLSRSWAAGRTNREARTEAAKDEFKSQINTNQVRSTIGRRINGEATTDRATAAKTALGIDATSSSNRVKDLNPTVNARHGGTALREREYDAGLEKERLEERDKGILMHNTDFDDARRAVDHAKSGAKVETARAEVRTEKAPGTFQDRARVAAAEGALEIAHEETKGSIKAAASDKWAADASASSLSAVERTELKHNELAQKEATSATAANTGEVDSEVAKIILTPDITTGGPSVAAQRAAGVAGDAGVSRARAAASQQIDAQMAGFVTNAQVLLAKADLTRDETRALALGGSATGKDGAHLDGGTDLAMRQAAIKKAVASNDTVGMKMIWDGIGSLGLPQEEETALRDTFADSLMASSSRPVYYGAGVIEAMRINDPTRFLLTAPAIAKAIDDGAYSPAKLVSSDQDELKEIMDLQAAGYLTPGQEAKLKADAHTAMNDVRLAPGLAKNRDNIAKIDAW